MKEDFKRNPNKKRDDSPLRWPANVHHTTTHNERIRWLWYENWKMYEELLITGDQLATKNPKIFKSMESFPKLEEIELLIEQIKEAISNNEYENLINLFKNHVEGYKP